MILVYKDFITIEEQEELEDWANSKTAELPVKKVHLREGATGERRSKFLKDHPQWLIDRIGLDIKKAKLIMHTKGAGTAAHIDRHWSYRANVLVRAADEGGLFRIEGNVVDFPERSLLIYGGDTSHEVTEVTEGSRVLLAHFYGPRHADHQQHHRKISN